jgi:hypothetical protein
MVSIKINLPFHPNITDTISVWDDFHEIEAIELLIDEVPDKYIINLKNKILLWQGTREKTLEHIKEEQQEMIEHGWELQCWYSSLPES